MPAPQQRHHANYAAQQGRGGNASTLTAISAPYNFVPLSDKVYLPDWGKNVSHDIPFQDGISGELHYTLTAETPLLVGGKQTKPGNGQPGEVKPFQLPDGTYAIPGSSLKGLLRSVVEIAAFGRMSKVDEVRPGLRDITTPNVSESYRNAVINNKVKTGFLVLLDDGTHRIKPCAMARLDHRMLETLTGETVPVFPKHTTVQKKYEKWSKICKRMGWDAGKLHFDLQPLEAGQNQAPIACNIGTGHKIGFPVFTGQISDLTDDKPNAKIPSKGKYKDFIFYPEDRPAEPLDVPPQIWRDFLFIHSNQEKEKEQKKSENGKVPSMSWPFYWRDVYRTKRCIPVFYILNDKKQVKAIGLAYMPKLAGDFSTHDMIRHTSPAHLQAPGAEQGYDLADLLFGAINGDRQADALRGRVSCDMARAVGKPQASQQNTTILNGPKPTYFPNYIAQPADPKNWRLKPGQQYATYIETSSSRAPTLRGFKRYPVRPMEDAKVQQLTTDQEKNKNVQVKLHTLPPKTTFAGRIVFHNLRPAELGALLWALTWGGDAALRHSLGMGKPFGFGQVRFDLQADRCRLIPNDPAQPETPLTPEWPDQLMQQYKEQMNAKIQGWEGSPQMRNLRAMANPDAAESAAKRVGLHLHHMELEKKEFQNAKKEGLVLADYAVATGALDAKDFRPLQGKPCPRSEPNASAGGANAATGAPAKPSAPPILEETQQWEGATLIWDNSKKTLQAKWKNKVSAPVVEAVAKTLMGMLPPEQRARLEKNKELKGAQATVIVKGNACTLQTLAWPTTG